MIQLLDSPNVDVAAVADALEDLRPRGATCAAYLETDGHHVCVNAVSARPEDWPAYSEAVSRRAASRGRRLLPVLDRGEVDGRLWIAYDMGSTTPLRKYRADRLLPTATSLRVLSDVARALDDAAGDGVFASELPPESVFVSKRGGRLGDLGTAREAFGRNPSYTLDGDRAFVPPEVLRGEPAGDRSGVYLLGALLYHLIAGASPRRGGPTPPGDGRPDLPVSLNALIATVMAEDPDHRPATAGDAYDMAKRALRGEPVTRGGGMRKGAPGTPKRAVAPKPMASPNGGTAPKEAASPKETAAPKDAAAPKEPAARKPMSAPKRTVPPKPAPEPKQAREPKEAPEPKQAPPAKQAARRRPATPPKPAGPKPSAAPKRAPMRRPVTPPKPAAVPKQSKPPTPPPIPKMSEILGVAAPPERGSAPRQSPQPDEKSTANSEAQKPADGQRAASSVDPTSAQGAADERRRAKPTKRSRIFGKAAAAKAEAPAPSAPKKTIASKQTAEKESPAKDAAATEAAPKGTDRKRRTAKDPAANGAIAKSADRQRRTAKNPAANGGTGKSADRQRRTAKDAAAKRGAPKASERTRAKGADGNGASPQGLDRKPATPKSVVAKLAARRRASAKPPAEQRAAAKPVPKRRTTSKSAGAKRRAAAKSARVKRRAAAKSARAKRRIGAKAPAKRRAPAKSAAPRRAVLPAAKKRAAAPLAAARRAATKLAPSRRAPAKPAAPRPVAAKAHMPRRAVALGGALLLGAGAGLVLASSPEPEPARAETVTAGGLSVTVPSGRFRVEGGDGSLSVRAPGSHLRAHIVNRPLEPRPDARAVQLGTVEAWRTASGRAVNYAIPTGQGTLEVTCEVTASATARALGLCERTASTLKVRDAEPLPLAPAVEEAERLRAAVAALSVKRDRVRARLGQASTPRGQRVLAQGLAGIHRRAATGLEGLAEGDSIKAAVRRAADAYSSLAAAAKSGSTARWETASERVRRADAALAEAIATAS